MNLTDTEIEEALALIEAFEILAYKQGSAKAMAQFVFIKNTMQKMKDYLDFHEFCKNVDKLEACYRLECRND